MTQDIKIFYVEDRALETTTTPERKGGIMLLWAISLFYHLVQDPFILPLILEDQPLLPTWCTMEKILLER